MQMYLLGEVDGPLYSQTADALAGLIAEQPELREDVLAISADVVAGDLYRALTRCRKLMPHTEGEVL
jgi:flagellar protein FlbT